MNIIADRMNGVPFSGIRKVFERVKELQAQGRDIVNLCIGRPDFDTPAHIKKAAMEALEAGFVHYTSNFGMDELRAAVADKLNRVNGVDCSPAEVIITIGANEAVFLGMMSLLNPGDEVIVPEPAWPHYRYCAQLIGARPVAVPLREENAFMVDPADIEKAMTARTKLIVINTPHNPTGSVLSPEAVAAIAELAVRKNVFVLSDEIYEYLVYGGAKHISIASLPGMKQRTVIVNGFSKAYAMDGWRLGYVAAPAEVISAMIRIHQYTTTCATSFAQAGAVAALTGAQDCVEAMRSEFDRRRRLVYEKINQVPGFCAIQPKGAFYAFVNVAGLGCSERDAAVRLLDEAGVAMVPGTAFGSFGDDFLRISYATAYERLVEGMNRLLARDWRQKA